MIDAVRAAGLLRADRRVVVLLSGGRDSSCLLDLAVRIAGPGNVRALHVNYGLRDDAPGDEQHCVALCEQLGVGLEIRRPRRPERGNVQAWARDVRYEAAASLSGGGDVAAGHTATDQVETILYRLASSPSRRALLGMNPRDGSLIRPLLAFTRAQTRAYCVERGLQWREDPSNEDPAYARNRVRDELVPALGRIHPAAEQNVLALAELLRDEAEVLDELVAGVLAGRDAIELARLRELPVALRRLVVQRLADTAVGGPAPGTARRADEILALTHGALDLPHGVRAIVEGGVLRFEPQKKGARERAPL
jgi:tRNA(Ile)-lysidine synthase